MRIRMRASRQGKPTTRSKVRIVDSQAEITKCQRRFVEILKSDSCEHGQIRIGHRGDTLEVKAFWDSSRTMWSGYRKLNRHWNVFGLGSPFAGLSAKSIVVEINPPLRGLNRKVGGVFLTDGDQFYVGHRGRIGGAKGISKRAFYSRTDLDPTPVTDGDRTSPVFILGSLGSPGSLLASIRLFVVQVAEIKGSIKEGRADPENPEKVRCWNESTEPRRYRTVAQDIETMNTHALVIAKLIEIIKGRKLAFAKDQRDLVVLKDGRPSLLFEAKSAIDYQSVYTAIGQLFYHARASESRVAVFPADLSNHHKKELTRLGVRLITFELVAGVPGFLGLDSILDAL